MSEADPTLLQEFITEAGELIEQLDSDLVKLERASSADEASTLLNGVFRALHTVKGAAGFLGLESLTRFAHAAEDALNLLRQGEVALAPWMMDTLLKCADTLRAMIDSIRAGGEPGECSAELMASLKRICQSGSGKAEADAPFAHDPSPEQASKIVLSPQKSALLDLMVTDLQESARQLDAALSTAWGEAAVRTIDEQIEGLARSLEFFELGELVALCCAARSALGHIDPAAPATEAQAALRSLVTEIETAAASLEHRNMPQRADASLSARLLSLAGGTPDASTRTSSIATPSAAATPRAEQVEPAASGVAGEAGPAAGPARQAGQQPAAGAVAGEQTIRVEVGRLEALLNVVGQLVLTKNRMQALNRRLRDQHLPAQLGSDVAGTIGELDRLMGELQTGVMRTRMQPLAKLLDRYPRVIRDIARQTGKKIELVIEGKQTEVDKSVLELLADPLVHMLRNSADHGIESPEARVASGKAETGTVRIAAEHQGSHVRVTVSDDGKGIDPVVISRKAIERGLATEHEIASMSKEQILQFIFAPGFSTAESVSDLSGRGVGMDVVNTHVAKMGGMINVYSEVGKGTSAEILIPLTVAILPAMVVGVGPEHYCIPLQSISEIVRPESIDQSIAKQPVIRVRDKVLPLIDLGQALRGATERTGRFAVVVAAGGQKVGLLVDRLVGQQEVVIRPLDDRYTQGGPFSGATIRDEGDVSLIIDISMLIRRWQSGERESNKGDRQPNTLKVEA